MKKTAQATTTATTPNEETAKPFLKVVSGDQQETKIDTGADAGQGETPFPDTVAGAAKTAVPFEQRQEAIETLHRKNLTLNRLKEDQAKLKEFQIELKEDPDNTENDYLNTCTFKIIDDKGRSYSAKSPQYISECLTLLKNKMGTKVNELENEIVWPF